MNRHTKYIITEHDFDSAVGSLEPDECEDEIADYLRSLRKVLFSRERSVLTCASSGCDGCSVCSPQK